jgi:hypothetical protein
VPLFGNYICDNRLRSSHVRRTGFATARAARGAIQIGNPSGANLTEPQSQQVALSHTIVSGNYVSCNDVGVTVSDFAQKTFLLSNEFQEVARPLLDWGMQTIVRNNRTRVVDNRGEVTTTIPDGNGRRPLAASATKE